MSDGIRFYSAGTWSVIGIIIIVCLVILVIPLLFLGFVGAAFARLGFSWIGAVAIILLMLIGGAINIPIGKIRRETVRIEYNDGVIPDGFSPWETVISLNLGGAVIPVVIAVYLLFISTPSGMLSAGSVIIAVLLVSALSFISVRHAGGAGILAPLFIPGLAALVCGLVLSGGVGFAAGVTAFVSGTFGTLIGANIANLHKIRELGIAKFSIGGAGTFGTVFIGCILSALIV